MENVISFIVLGTVVLLVVAASLVSWVKENPREYKKLVKATAELISFPFYLGANIRHNIRAHNRGLKRVEMFSDNDALDKTLQGMLKDLEKAQATTEAIDQARTREEIEEFNEPPSHPRRRRKFAQRS